uniref:Uncharacterized protein n=1 Tax=mine drainage metagenome TaxID=410659 RepID=E6QMY4_9ZZZZ
MTCRYRERQSVRPAQQALVNTDPVVTNLGQQGVELRDDLAEFLVIRAIDLDPTLRMNAPQGINRVG